MNKHIIYILLLAILQISPITGQEKKSKWTYLIEDNSLKNFTQLNGNALFKIEQGELIGISKLNTPNSFLATKARYTDFILEFEVWVDYGLNSGVQFRSNSLAEYNNGRVHG